ncbi:MAG: hypothetical protein F6J86_22240 [Symploca sp. SIO1B1]|nr:hypothetical protein [Symploca sp. SIO1B1]
MKKIFSPPGDESRFFRSCLLPDKLLPTFKSGGRRVAYNYKSCTFKSEGIRHKA